jgi:hypothetical protein
MEADGAADEVEAEQKAKVIKNSVENETHPACIQILLSIRDPTLSLQ